jgi:hypothetical protein
MFYNNKNNNNQMICIDCNTYYRLTPYNQSTRCNNCFQYKEESDFEQDLKEELDFLQSKEGSRTTRPIFYE